MFCLETCGSQSKCEKKGSGILRKKNDEVKQETADSSSVNTNPEDTTQVSLDTSNLDGTDSNEAEAKENDADECQLNDNEDSDATMDHSIEAKINHDTTNHSVTKEFDKNNDVAQIDIQNTDNIKIEIECIDNKQTNNLEIVDEAEKVEERMTESNEDAKEKMIVNKNINVGVKEFEVIPEVLDDEDNIQDEELDHEVDEEDIKGSTDDFNQTNDTVSSIFILTFLNCINVYFNLNLGKIYSRK